MITTRAIAIGRGRAPLLTGLDLHLAAGECWAVVGRNGVGKSTLLATLAGLLPALGGEISIRDRPLAAWHRRELAREVAFLPQQHSAVFPYTVEEFVEFGRVPWRGQPADDAAAVERAILGMELAEIRDRPLTALSGGEVQRVSIAQLLAQETATILLDEPLAHLDLLHQVTAMRLLRSLATQGRTVAIATHDLALAWRYCPRWLVLGPGFARVLTPGDANAAATLSWAYDVEFEVNADGPRLHAVSL